MIESCFRCGCKFKRNFEKELSPPDFKQMRHHPKGGFVNQQDAAYCSDCAPDIEYCHICGCTDEAGCESCCCWIADGLCSACADME